MKTAEYKFLGEVQVIFPDCDGEYDEDDTELEPVYVCIVRCSSCGWYMFGDGWCIGQGFTERGEQIPQYCAHCGVKFEGESE